MKVFLREWWVYDFTKGSLKLKTVYWSNCVFKPTFFSKEIEMKVKDLILKLQERNPDSQVVVVYNDGEIIVNGILLTMNEGMFNFDKELRELLNKYSVETASDTPDFILATYLFDCLRAFNRAVRHRDSLNE